MNIVRAVISVFLLILIGVAATGWVWSGRHQTAAQSAASRVVLSVCIAAGALGLAMLWRTKKQH